MNILVVDDNEELLALLERSLVRDGHQVAVALDVATARAGLAARRIDLVVLDLSLPDGSGLEFCRELRRGGSDLPILVLTAQTSVGARVDSLDAGADDHLGKPFAVAELRARVRALLRRTTLAGSSPLCVGAASIDFRAHIAKVAGKSAPITPREWEILELLAARKGTVVSRAELLQLVWPGDANAEASLEVLISRLRRKLGSSVVRTVRGEGYALGEE